MAECKVLSGATGLEVQLVLGLTSILALVLKYKVFQKDRTPKQFVGDTAKQLIGSLVLHALNILFAERSLGDLQGSKVDQCTWYVIQVVVDDTVGVWVAFTIFHVLLGMLRGLGKTELAWDIVRSERKHADPDGREKPLLEGYQDLQEMTLAAYASQVIFWVAVVVGMKIAMVVFIFVFANPLQLAAGLLARLPTFADHQLLLDMVVIPTVFNALQFWLVDEIFLDAFRTESLARMNIGFQEKVNLLTVGKADLESQLAIKDKVFRSQADCLLAKSAEISDCQEKMQVQAGQIEHLQAEGERLSREKEAVARQNAELEEHLQAKAELDAAGEKLAAEYRVKIERLQAMLAEHQERAARAEEEARRLHAEKAELQRKAEDAEARLAEANERNVGGFLSRILRPAARLRSL